MEIFKFKDKIDGNYAFIIAIDEKTAIEKMKTLTSIDFELIEKRNKIEKAIIILNKILPF